VVEESRIAFRGATIDPVDDEPDLFLAQGRIRREAAESADGIPGRHAAGEDLFADGDGPGPGLFVGGNRERGGAVLSMATDAARGKET
jgi:hypothetical protein